MRIGRRFTAAAVALALLLPGAPSGPWARAEEEHVTNPGVPRLRESPRARAARTPAVGDETHQARRDARLAELRAENAADPLELDAFGGWANAPASVGKGAPGRFFRVEKRGGAWWFITPEGNPLVSKGVTDVNWLGARLAPDRFHDVIVAKYGNEASWVAAARERMRDWGFNTIGPWSSASIAAEMTHSVVILDVAAGISPRHPGALVTDYWDPAFAAHCGRMAGERAAPHVEDPRLLGYFLDNEIVWGADHFRTNESLVQLYAGFPPEAPGRIEMLRFLRGTAGTLEAFNAAWGVAFDDWAQLDGLTGAQFQPETPAAHAATEAFMLHAFDRYATTAIAELRAVDPNHLILGCRFHNYPGDALARAAARHFDVISLAFYEARPPVAEIDAVWPEIDTPFLIEEWTFKSDDSGIRNTLAGIYAPRVRTQAERGLAYHDYVEAFMRRPYAIGYHWYKLMDNPVLGPDQPLSGDNCGLVNAEDEPYAPFVEFVREVNRRVERWHAEGGAAQPRWER